MDSRQKVVDFLRFKGPSLPYEVGKNIGGDTLFASAWLSELKEMSKVRISYLKVGGSPLYYLPGQESMLQHFSGNLEDKEKKAFESLKTKKVLQDSALVPVFKVAIRELRDFAIPLTVQFDGRKELFWKWYLVPGEEANSLIKGVLNIKESEIKKEIAEKIEEKTQKIEEKKVEKIEQKKLAEEKKITPESQKKPESDFNGDVKAYFNKSGIIIIETLVKKASDIEAIAELPSPVGNLRFFIKARKKKKVTDGDLSSAFVQGQSKRLPVLFLTSGELTKKAKEMLESEFKGMKVNYLGR